MTSPTRKLALLGFVVAAVTGLPSSIAQAAPASGPFKNAVVPVGHWETIGPAIITAPPIPPYGSLSAVGRLTTIAIDPTNSQVMYVGSIGQLGHEGCGIWKTTNGSASWTPVADALPTLSVGAIAIDPTNHNRVYAVTADEGFFRSEDAGLTWTNLHGDLHIRTNTNDGDRTNLLIDPTNPSVIFLTSDDGVLRSQDGGLTWPVSLSAGNHAASSLAMDPRNPNVLYAAMVGKGIYKTTTGGAAGESDWTQQTQSPLPFDGTAPTSTFLLSLSHPAAEASETVYAVLPASGGFDVYRTTDGSTWSKRASCNPCSFFITMVANPAESKTVHIGGPLLYNSLDGGDSFTQVPTSFNDRQPASAHGDYWELTVDPNNPAILYAGSDGGFFRSTDHGKEGTWSFNGQGITSTEMYDIALTADTPPHVLCGNQDNGTILYTGTLDWDHIPHTDVFGSDGGGVAADPNDPNRFYAVRDNQGTPDVSLDGGSSFVNFAGGFTSAASCAIWKSRFHLLVHPAKPETLLASCEELWRTTTNTPPGSWVKILTVPNQEVVHAAVDVSRDLYYAGTSGGRVYAGAGGSGWAQVFEHPGFEFLSDLEVDPLNPDVVYASFAPPTTVDRGCGMNAGTQRVYQLKLNLADLPSLRMSSSDITANLPAGLCVNAIAVDPRVPRTIYAATNHGVYRARSNATGGPWVWTSYNDGMPQADVRDLEVHRPSGHIFAATFGRSAFEVTPETILPVAIDIKPGSSINPINLGSKGKIPVAILSSPVFDAPAEVDCNSLTFGSTGNELSLAFCDPVGKDVNGDGLLDLICHFYNSATGITRSNHEAILKGHTFEGTPIEGRDAVNIVPVPFTHQGEGIEEQTWSFDLGPAVPNPTTGAVRLGYTLVHESQVTLVVFDVSGHLVRTLVDGSASAGPHQLTWDATNDQGRHVGPGIYFYRLNAGSWHSQRRVVFLER